jgi:DNA topoisomerase-2
MGQVFVGGNNLALIKPLGHFGSRYYNGKDLAPVNSLLTFLPKLTSLLFPEDDFPIL